MQNPMVMNRFLLTACFVFILFTFSRAQATIITLKGDTIEGKAGGFDANLPYHTLDLSFSTGPSYLIASTKEAKEEAMQLGMTSEQADDYYRQLKLGWSGSAKAHWYFSPGLGIGLHYKGFVTGASDWITLDPHDGVNRYEGEMKETMYVSYVGPSCTMKRLTGKKGKYVFTSAASAGMTFYRDEATIIHSNLLLTGKAFGASLDAGLEYRLTNHLSLGLQAGLFASGLRKVTMDDGVNKTIIELDRKQYENVSFGDLSAVIRITL